MEKLILQLKRRFKYERTGFEDAIAFGLNLETFEFSDGETHIYVSQYHDILTESLKDENLIYINIRKERKFDSFLISAENIEIKKVLKLIAQLKNTL